MVTSNEVSDPDGQAGQERVTTQQFVTFVAGDEVFAVDMAPVQEIIRSPEVVRLPLAPATLDGLANLRGKILPIVSLRRIFGFPDRDKDDATRAVVINVGQPLGFIVDRVASVLDVDVDKIEAPQGLQSTIDTELLAGLLKNVGDYPVIMVLDFKKLVQREFAHIATAAKSEVRLHGGLEVQKPEGEERQNDELQLVSFRIASQEYAIDIADVQEIVQVPPGIIRVPHCAPHVVGVMSLRNRLLPLVDLRQMFGLPVQVLDDRCRIVVLAHGASSIGVVVDGVSEVLRVAKELVDPLPALLAKGGEMPEIASVCRLEQGKRLVSVITSKNLLDHSAFKDAINIMSEANLDEAAQADELDTTVDDDEQVVIFRLDKEEFGVPIHSVQEIVRVPEELVHVPGAPDFVEGVINLRGSVLPVVDLRARLGLPGIERSDSQRIMVFLIADVRTGFIVDQVAEVLRIARDVIEPAPSFSGQQSALLARMANMEKQGRMVQLLEPTQLVNADEMAGLASLG
ncbi:MULTISPECIES: chemotaxis protein CheW [unclassified Herbaspirillum]|uniref:chemotaxis protein CheW n=1 Tax=unclassified Herbaspirillum TaxID=2624150 RepID=UPI001E494F1A|nr:MULTISPECIES: chemotaxis protein CheW [unclassified Herbaspirillum]